MASNFREQMYTLAALATKPSVIMRPMPEPPPYVLGDFCLVNYSDKDDFAFYVEERLNVHILVWMRDILDRRCDDLIATRITEEKIGNTGNTIPHQWRWRRRGDQHKSLLISFILF